MSTDNTPLPQAEVERIAAEGLALFNTRYTYKTAFVKMYVDAATAEALRARAREEEIYHEGVIKGLELVEAMAFSEPLKGQIEATKRAYQPIESQKQTEGEG